MATKIALIGTHGVGKSTIAYGLSFVMKMKGKNVELVAEVARTCPLPINENTTLESQLWIISTQKKREIEASARAEMVICDRSLLDDYAYYQSACSRLYSNIDPFPSTKYEVFEWMKTYDLLVFLYPNMPLVEDGVRSVNETFQQDISNSVLNLIQDYELETESNLPIIFCDAAEFECKQDIFSNPKTLAKITDALSCLKN